MLFLYPLVRHLLVFQHGTVHTPELSLQFFLLFFVDLIDPMIPEKNTSDNQDEPTNAARETRRRLWCVPIRLINPPQGWVHGNASAAQALAFVTYFAHRFSTANNWP